MARDWSDLKPSRRCTIPQPLQECGAKLGQIRAENAARHAAEEKEFISLAVGDPALDGNLPPPPVLIQTMVTAISESRSNGYTLCHGAADARQAVADYWTRSFTPSLPNGALSAKDVILTCGCLDALSISFGAVAMKGDRILIPEPYFPHYDMICAFYGIEPIYYPCRSECNWEVDMDALRQILDGDAQHRIRALLLTNPSNPCGSNFSRAHTAEVVRFAEEWRLPIISDEVYAGMTFNVDDPSADVPFTSVADIPSNATRFVVSGASKRLSIPGARMGWIIRIDPTDAGSELMLGCLNLAARFFVPTTPLQSSMVKWLPATDEAYFTHAKKLLCANAVYLYATLSKIPCLTPMKPEGGMFMSVLLKPSELEETVADGVGFANKLAEEENIQVFPGEPFHMPCAFRLTLSRPLPICEKAVQRIVAFCERHRRN